MNLNNGYMTVLISLIKFWVILEIYIFLYNTAASLTIYFLSYLFPSTSTSSLFLLPKRPSS